MADKRFNTTPAPNDLIRVIHQIGIEVCSRAKLQRHYKVGRSTIDRWLNEVGINLNPRSVIISKLQTNHPIPEDFNIVCDQLDRLNKLSNKNLMTHYNISNPAVITKWLRSLNIEVDRHKQYPLPTNFEHQFNVIGSIMGLAKFYGVSSSVVNRWQKETNLYYPNEEPPFTREELEYLHVDRKLTFTSISEKLGVPRHTIVNLMNKYKIDNVSDEPLIDEETLLDLHHHQKKTQHEISNILGIHQTTISLYMKKYNIEVKRHKGSSWEEKQVLDFIKENYDGVVETQNLWGFEYDIVVPEFNLAIEYNGLRFHSEEYGYDKYRHYNKFKAAEDSGYRLINLFSDEWYHKSDIVKSIILNHLKLTPNKIFARQCTIERVESSVANLFYEENHIQGATRRNKHNVALIHEDQIVACMTLGLHPRNESMVLSRFCTRVNTNVVGAASKIFKFVSDQIRVDDIISWSDNRWSDGNLYGVLGFSQEEGIPISYDYVTPDKRNRVSAQRFQKSKMGVPADITEAEYMAGLKYFRIWNCGKKTWRWKRKER